MRKGVESGPPPHPVVPGGLVTGGLVTGGLVSGVLGAGCLSLALLLPAGCGGGGGGGGFVGAALVSVSVDPSTVDPGGRLRADVRLDEVNRGGILLKFRYPDGLRFPTGSASLTVAGTTTSVAPSAETPAGDGKTYLVFPLPPALFGEEEGGDFSFLLEGVKEAPDGRLEADADVDDPAVPDAAEFSPADPKFGAEDEVFVEVRD